MRRVFLILFLLPVFAIAQKQPKPNINKAFNAWKEGKLDEAKEIIDQATTYEKTMNDGKTWYYRGLIYATLDTTSNEAHKALATDPLATAIESMKKADELGKKDADYFIPPDPALNLPMTKSQQLEMLANYYLNNGITIIQSDEPDFDESIKNLEKSIQVFENTLTAYSNDTLTYYVLGLAAYNGEKPQMAIDALTKYVEKGGTSKDAYILMYQTYANTLDNKEKALEVIRKAKKALPNNTDFPRLEIGLLIDLNRLDEAKSGLEQEVAQNPNDKVLRFYLAYANATLKNKEEAIKQYNEALRIDPGYFDAQYHLTQLYLADVDAISKEINNLGISAADEKKKRELFLKRVKICEETAIPNLEKLEKMQAPDTESKIDVLEKLELMYYYVADDAKEKVVKQKLKALGVE